MNGEEMWACPACTLENPSNHKRCHACQSRRPVEEQQQQQRSSSTPTVLAWLQKRRNKRKRSPQPTVRVKIHLNGEEWQPLQARISQSRRTSQIATNAGANRDHDAAVSGGNESKEVKMTENSQSSPGMVTVGSLRRPEDQEAISENVGNDENSQPVAEMSHMSRQQEESGGSSKDALENVTSQESFIDASRSLPETESIVALRQQVDRENVSQPAEAELDSPMPVDIEISPQHYEERGNTIEERKTTIDHTDTTTSSQPLANPMACSSRQQSLESIANKDRENALDNDERDSILQKSSQSSTEGAGVDSVSIKETNGACRQEDIDRNAVNSSKEVCSHGEEGKSSSDQRSLSQPPKPKSLAQRNDEGGHEAETAPAFSPASSHTTIDAKVQSQVDEIDDNVQMSETPISKPLSSLESECHDAAEGGEKRNYSVPLETGEKALADVNTSSQEDPVDIGFSQLMSQEPGGFLYTQMSQGEAEYSTSLHQVDSADATENEALHPSQEGMNARREVDCESGNEERPDTCSQASIQRRPLQEMNPPSSELTPGKEAQSVAQKETNRLSTSPVALKTVKKESLTPVMDTSKECDVTTDSMMVPPESRVQSTPMFQTAGRGSVISVSDDSLARANMLLQDTVASSEEGEKMPTASESSLPVGVQQFPAVFQTAGKRSKISVNEDSLNKANALLEESKTNCVEASAAALVQTAASSNICSHTTEHFRTSEERRVASLDSMPHGDVRPHDWPCTGGKQPKRSVLAESAEKSFASPLPPSFQTAGKGTRISVSEDSLAIAGALLHGSEASDASDRMKAPPNRRQPTFHTAGRQTAIIISDESIKHATRLLTDMPDACTEPVRKSPSRDLARDSCCPPSAMFQTAGNGSVLQVSAEGMARAATLLEDKTEASDTSKEASSPKSSSPHADATKHDQIKSTYPGTATAFSRCPPSAPLFQSAGKGNLISVTGESLARANSLFKEASSSTAADGTNERQAPGPSLSSDAPVFQTAGRKTTIPVSDGSMARATALLHETTPREVASDRKPVPSLSQPKVSFQTAGRGNVIFVSEETLVQASAVLDGKSSKVTETAQKEAPPRTALAASLSDGVPRFSASFRSAGKSDVISVTEESLDKAKGLLREQNEAAGDHEKSIEDRPPPVTEIPTHAPVFQTAGRRTLIQVPEDSLSRAASLLEATGTTNFEPDQKEPFQDFASTSTGNAIPMFQTAGKRNKISVSEDSFAQATVLLRDTKEHAGARTERSELPRPDASLRTDAPSPSLPGFRTGGKNSIIAISEENMVRAGALLQDAPPERLEDRSEINARTRAPSFQTAGKGSMIAVSEENVARASEILQDTTLVGAKVDDNELSSNVLSIPTGTGLAQPVTDNSITRPATAFQEPPDSENEKRRDLSKSSESQDATGNSTTAECSSNERSMREGLNINKVNSPSEGEAAAANEPLCVRASLHDCTNDTADLGFGVLNVDDQGLITQPLPPETPLLFHRREQSGQGVEEGSLRIRSVAFGLTPQSQSSNREESRSDDVPVPRDDTTEDGAYPAITPSNCTTRGKIQESSESIRKLPAFTPKQTPAETNNAVVTMSFDPKKLHDNPSHSLIEKQTPSPVPINFRHLEGSFRGEPLSRSSISFAENVLAGNPTSSLCNEVVSTQAQSSTENPGSLDAPVSRTKKVVTWSEEQRNAELIPGHKCTLSEFASKYGDLDDSLDVCRDAGVHAVTLAVDSSNATRVRFDPESRLPCSFFGQASPPGCKPIGSVRDLRESLVTRGCDEKKLSDKWISNHSRWIVWKLASTERRFAYLLCQSYLTYDNLITQLHQRYDKELKGGKRSALRKVLNQDVAANSMMILCVSQISTIRPSKSNEADAKSANQSEYALELTDGWYAIRGALDAKLSALVDSGRIKVGSKLLTCNAKLDGSEDGIDPLDSCYASSGRNCPATLCLIANGTRLAKWDAKLGFVKPTRSTSLNRGSLLVRAISDIIPGGGNVPLIDLVVCRLYPRMFVERQGASHPSEMLEKLVGKSPVISEAMEYKNRMNFEKKRQQAMERLSETVQNECVKEVDEMAPELWQSLMKSASPGDFYEQLSGSDQAAIDKWKDKRDHLLRDMVQNEIEARLEGETALCRESTPFVRVFVKSYNTSKSAGKDNVENNTCEGALLTVWNPSEHQLSLLREGNVVRIRNLSVRASKHEGLLQLTAGAKTQMESTLSSPIPQKTLASIGYMKRSFTNFLRVHLTAKKLSAALLPSSPAPEVDTTGIVLRVSQEGSGSTEERETIYLTDETGMTLRVERDHFSDEDDDEGSLSLSALQNIESPVTMAFRDLRVTHFDSTENCAVAVYAQTSSIATKAASSRVSSLIRWAKSPVGNVLLRRVAACMDAGIPMNQPSSTATVTAIGYIAGFDIPDANGANHSHLEIRVDCGMPNLQVWDFPFFLLDDALHICSVAPEPVSLDQVHDEKYANLKVLGKIFSARGLLLVFSLRKRPSNMANRTGEDERYEVRHVKVADSSALAELLVHTE